MGGRRGAVSNPEGVPLGCIYPERALGARIWTCAGVVDPSFRQDTDRAGPGTPPPGEKLETSWFGRIALRTSWAPRGFFSRRSGLELCRRGDEDFRTSSNSQTVVIFGKCRGIHISRILCLGGGAGRLWRAKAGSASERLAARTNLRRNQRKRATFCNGSGPRDFLSCDFPKGPLLQNPELAMRCPPPM